MCLQGGLWRTSELREKPSKQIEHLTRLDIRQVWERKISVRRVKTLLLLAESVLLVHGEEILLGHLLVNQGQRQRQVAVLAERDLPVREHWLALLRLLSEG